MLVVACPVNFYGFAECLLFTLAFCQRKLSVWWDFFDKSALEIIKML